MADKEQIKRELLAGVPTSELIHKYPQATVYPVYDELVASGDLSADVTEPEEDKKDRTGAEEIKIPGAALPSLVSQ